MTLAAPALPAAAPGIATGTATAPDFADQTGVVNPFTGVNVGFRSTPSFADLDSDGDFDAVVGEIDGVLNYFRNGAGVALVANITAEDDAGIANNDAFST